MTAKSVVVIILDNTIPNEIGLQFACSKHCFILFSRHKKVFIVNDFFLYHFELVVSLVYLVKRRELLGSNRVFLDLCDRSWKYGNGFVVDESNTAIIIVYRNGSRKVRRWMKIGYS